MEKYEFPAEKKAFLEGMRVPFAIYQFVDKRVVTLVLSAGFCRLFGYEDRAEAYHDMDHNMYKDTHPDDVSRIANAAVTFATEGGKYDVLYRSRMRPTGYRIIHAQGEHILTEEGVRLAQVWYFDEGPYSGDKKGANRLNRELRSALYEGSLLRARSYDYLTGLPSVTYFLELAESAKEAALRSGEKPVMLYMDFVNMKLFNHNYSFSKGDELLQEFARLLSSAFGTENCSRFGKDQFAVFTTDERLEKRLEQLFRDCAALNGGNSLPLRVGIYREWEEDIRASKACDWAKIACDALRKSSESIYGCYNSELRQNVARRSMIQSSLDRALAEKHIQVYYQPIIRTANGRICDEEALARWIDPQEGFLSPAEFIPYLEDSGQIHRLDLYVLEQVLEKLRAAKTLGYQAVPHSINLSRGDFDACDMVEEICERVDAAGIERELISIELTETTVGSDFERMKEQISRFRELGFSVWLDDFGSGYSSMDTLQSIHFDMIKFDMSFMRKLDDGENGKIVLTELVKLATSLGADTVCEGVETLEQVQFLQEIGCAKLQGYYYEKPVPLQEVIYRQEHPKIGYENPDEVAYYEAIGRVNLYDLDMVSSEEDSGLKNYFNTVPMGIIEVRGECARFVRSNQSYRQFVKRFLGFDLSVEGTDFAPYDAAFVENVVKTCCEQGLKSFFDEQLPNGFVVHSFARRVGVNPVTGTVAVVVAVLSITDADELMTYESIVRALASDYYHIYCVDLDTEHFIEYSSQQQGVKLAMERHGENFFASVKQESQRRVYSLDRETFLEAFTKENIVRELDNHGVFMITYRLVDSGKPLYVNMKVIRMSANGNQIILGVSVVDGLVKQRQQLEKARKERETLSKAMALSEDYISLYWIDPETSRYVQYSAAGKYWGMGIKEGNDFFLDGRREAEKVICPDDQPRFMEAFTRDNVLADIRKKGVFQIQYCLVYGGESQNVSFRIARIRDVDGEKLIAGVRSLGNEQQFALSTPVLETREAEFQCMADQLTKPCAILSVEKNLDGTPGDVRIVRANREYKEAMGGDFHNNMLYYELVPKVQQFEYSCFRAAFLHQQVHTYVQSKVEDQWTDLQLIPLHSDQENIGYCQFILEISQVRNRERMAAVSIHSAGAVLRSAITLLSGENDLKARADQVVQDLMELSGAFNVRILLSDHENRQAINYCNKMVIELPEDFEAPEEDPDKAVITYEVLTSWDEMIGHNNSLVVTTPEEMDALEERNPTWVRRLRAYMVDTLMLVPLRHEHERIGYLYLCNFDANKTADVRELAELMCFFLGTEIYNEILLKRLDEMSHTDALTGLNNRNAMIQRTKLLNRSEKPIPFGLVNLDLNGLKVVNDTGGHDAGDRLLVNAAEILKKYFYSGDLYRTGGDEFVVIATDITKEAFERKVARLRNATRKPGSVSFAMGAIWSDGSQDINSAFRKADEIMYADKKAHYSEHPSEKR